MKTSVLTLAAATAATATCVTFVPAAPAARLASYYVGVDNRDMIGYSQPGSGNPSQTYTNPNDNRLTLLLQHGDHFHALGAYSFTGPTASPSVLDTNANNRTPEVSSGLPPIRLVPAPAGHPLAGRYVSGIADESEYAHLEIRSFESLFGFGPGSPEQTLADSSAGRWNTHLTGSVVALEVVSITPGLAIADQAGTTVLDGAGDVFALGPGDAFRFEPVFHAAADAPFGTYTAELRLVDQRGSGGSGAPFGSSGRFFVDVAVPEPSALSVLAPAAGAVHCRWRRRRHARTAA